MRLTKYGMAEIQEFNQTIGRLTNQLWKLIPMRENNEDWVRQLDTVLLEIIGLNEVLTFSPPLLELISKLEGLKLSETSFMLYRKTVFEAISLLQVCGHDFAE